ncbi:MAG: hypothetical protein IEMM0002_1425 [bacterium]|nr:MAG: hypothetical protein IEMM0002_1425 [bacterium]
MRAAAITALAAASAAFAYSGSEASAVVSGGGLAILNFMMSSKFLKKVIVPGVEPSFGKALSMSMFGLRYVMTGVVIYLLIRAGTNPVFFIIGLSAIVGAIILSYKNLKERRAA